MLIEILSSEGLKVVGQGLLLPGELPDEKKEEEEKERLQTLCVPLPSPSPWQCHGPAPELSTRCLLLTLPPSQQLARGSRHRCDFHGFRVCK